MTSTAEVVQSRHGIPPASVKDLHLWPVFHVQEKLLALLRCNVNTPGEDCSECEKQISPDSEKSSLPRFHRIVSLASSGTLPTHGLFGLEHHRRHNLNLPRLSNLRSRRLLARRRCKVNREKNLPPCRGKVGAPGADQSPPTLPPPRRLVVVLQSCDNQWNNTGSNYTTGTKPLFTPFHLTLFLSSINHFITTFLTLITPYLT